METPKNKVFSLIDQEQKRQEQTINLIASENYTSSDVMQATGSILTNKYAEGYPGARYYGGCEVVDQIENIARDLGKKLFQAEHINVQPHSGSSANFAVYMSHLEPGDTILGMSLTSGGHLTHGHFLNFSGRLYNFIPYGVSPETELLDYDELEILAQQHQPKMIVVGASAYSRTIDFKRCAHIAHGVGALLFVDMAHIAGLIAAGVHPSPVPYADIISSTTHKTLRGPRGGMILSTQELAQKLDKSIIPGCQGGPLLHVMAAKAIAFAEAADPAFTTYQQQVVQNAHVMAAAFIDLGYRIVSGGTDNHLFLVDLKKSTSDVLTGKEITGKLVEETLGKCGIVLNRNTIPFDTASPFVTSGIRIGTPAVTTRGFKEAQILEVVELIAAAIRGRDDESKLAAIGEKVKALCARFPIY